MGLPMSAMHKISACIMFLIEQAVVCHSVPQAGT
jgi:hypothetical protein